MKMLFKQRFFSWFDSYDIYDEAGNVLYTVEGKLAWGHCLHILDSAGRHIGTVKEKIFTFLPRFELYLNDRYIGDIHKEFTFFKPVFKLDCNNWMIEGDIFQWNYQISNGLGGMVATAEKKIWNFTDTYEISVLDPCNAIYALMIVLAIDAAKCSGGD